MERKTVAAPPLDSVLEEVTEGFTLDVVAEEGEQD